MKPTVISDLEVKTIARELLINAASVSGIKYAWLLENDELKECLRVKDNEFFLLISHYSDTLWKCHFASKSIKNNFTQAETDRYVKLVEQKNMLRDQIINSLSRQDT